MNYKKVGTIIVSLIFTFGLVAPNARASENSTTKTPAFCGRLSVVESNTAKRLANQETKLDKARADRIAKVANQRSERDAKLAEARANADANRTKNYERLLGKADNDSKKQAVAVFKTTVENAAVARKAEVNSSTTSFRAGVDTILKTHKAAIDTAVNIFKTRVNNALSQAQANCTGGQDSKTVKKNFNSSLKIVKEQFKIDKNKIAKPGSQIDQLSKIRKIAVENAFKNFRTALEQAKTVLKTNFK